MNIFVITGYLGKDAEIRSTPGGKQVTGFSVGSNQGYGENKHTVWVRCSWWGDRGVKLAPYLTKGTHVLVVARIDEEPRIWTGRTGEPAASYEVTVTDVELLGGGQREEQPGAAQAPRSLADVDSVPF